MESARWTSCHGLGCVVPFILNRGAHAQGAVATLAVMEDLQVLEDRVGWRAWVGWWDVSRFAVRSFSLLRLSVRRKPVPVVVADGTEEDPAD
jgi:hypothetical protein